MGREKSPPRYKGRTPQDFSQDTKQKIREDRRKEEKMGRVYLEVDHIVPRYANGPSIESNAEALSRSEHLGKHVLGALYPEPEQNPQSEWFGARQIMARMDLDEFVDFVAEYGEAIAGAKDQLVESSPILKWRKRSGK